VASPAFGEMEIVVVSSVQLLLFSSKIRQVAFGKLLTSAGHHGVMIS
jgi:hypothetical protein